MQSPRTSAYLHFSPVGGTEEGADSRDECVRQPDQLLSNRQRGGWTAFILHYQALCSLWSQSLRHLKAESSARCVSALSRLTPPLTFTVVMSVFRGSAARGSGVRDAVLDLVHPQLSAGRVRGAKVVDALAGLQLERVSDNKC